MSNYTDSEYFDFFLEQFKEKANGEYCCVMIYPFRGEAHAIKKMPEDMKDDDTDFVYSLNKKELEYFRKHKELCNQWIALKRKEK